MSAAGIEIVVTLADLSRPTHQHAIVELLDMYARDEMGGGKPLADDVRQRLIPALQTQPGGRYFLAFAGERPVGMAICFAGFSTFHAAPLLNIHDIAVVPDLRGQGIGRQLLMVVEQVARRLGCCRLTLEVRADNLAGRRAYEKFGFAAGDPQTSAMSFWTKELV